MSVSKHTSCWVFGCVCVCGGGCVCVSLVTHVYTLFTWGPPHQHSLQIKLPGQPVTAITAFLCNFAWHLVTQEKITQDCNNNRLMSCITYLGHVLNKQIGDKITTKQMYWSTSLGCLKLVLVSESQSSQKGKTYDMGKHQHEVLINNKIMFKVQLWYWR